jgi:hypothetical protein
MQYLETWPCPMPNLTFAAFPECELHDVDLPLDLPPKNTEDSQNYLPSM